MVHPPRNWGTLKIPISFDAIALSTASKNLKNRSSHARINTKIVGYEASLIVETDVLVIGGGATGGGIAWDLALRGVRVILAEMGDLATGTSGRYHGLLHSGGRYAVRDPESAQECIDENRIVRRIAPEAIEDTSGFFVLCPGDDAAYVDQWLTGCADVGHRDARCAARRSAQARAGAQPEAGSGLRSAGRDVRLVGFAPRAAKRRARRPGARNS